MRGSTKVDHSFDVVPRGRPSVRGAIVIVDDVASLSSISIVLGSGLCVLLLFITGQTASETGFEITQASFS